MHGSTAATTETKNKKRENNEVNAASVVRCSIFNSNIEHLFAMVRYVCLLVCIILFFAFYFQIERLMLVVFHFLFLRLFLFFLSFFLSFDVWLHFGQKKNKKNKIVSVFWLLLFLVPPPPPLLLQFNSLRVFNNKFPFSIFILFVRMRCALLFAISQFQIARRCMYWGSNRNT